MRILWITNILFPEASVKLFGDKELKSTGGWMLGAANTLIQYPDIELYVASVSPKVKKLRFVDGDKIKYCILPLGKGNRTYNSEYESYWRQVKDIIKPDVIHIYGTEYTHGLAYVNACGKDNVVVSIQGLVSVYARYYLAGISISDFKKNITFYDVIKGSALNGQKLFEKLGICERELLAKVNHIIGRTSWDQSHSWAINSKAHYHFCNETLRNEFYGGDNWEYDKCIKHSIFLSQASYPIKGLHQVLKAMPIILQHYPNAVIRVAGADITNSAGFSRFLKYTGYGKYVKSLIKKLQLEDHVTFTGNLNAEEMKAEYLNCNVFVCPSSIENSPNSLGEAQILGTPCIASYVGGIKDMMSGDQEHMYQFEEIEIMAKLICEIFSEVPYTSPMQIVASERHERHKNAKLLSAIYRNIIESK